MNSYKFKNLIAFFAIVSLIAIDEGCKKEDPYEFLNNINSDAWAPQSLNIEDVSITHFSSSFVTRTHLPYAFIMQNTIIILSLNHVWR